MVHLIFVTKYRKKIVLGDFRDAVKQYLFDTCVKNHWYVKRMETDQDHVHILLQYKPYWFHYSYCVYIKTTQYLLILAATFCPVRTTLLEKACSMVRQLFCSVYWHRITSSYRTIYWKPRIIFLKRPAFHSEHFRFSEHEKRKDQNNLKPHYKIAPKGAGLPYQIC